MELIFGGGKYTKCIDQPQFSSVALHASTVSCFHELSHVPEPGAQVASYSHSAPAAGTPPRPAADGSKPALVFRASPQVA